MARPTPLARAVEHSSPPCVDPPRPSRMSTHHPPAPTAHWRCPDAPPPARRTVPRPSTTNADTTKLRSTPKRLNAPAIGNNMRNPKDTVAKVISSLDHDPRATPRRPSSGSPHPRSAPGRPSARFLAELFPEDYPAHHAVDVHRFTCTRHQTGDAVVDSEIRDQADQSEDERQIVDHDDHHVDAQLRADRSV